MSERVAVHLIQNYLALAENWMYEYIHRHRQYPPLVLTNRTQNLELFALPHGRIISLAQRSLGQRVRDRLGRQLGTPSLTYLRAVRQSHSRIIHAHFGDIGWQYRWLAQRTRAALLVSFYGYDIGMLGQQDLWRTRYRELFRAAARCIVMAPWMAERLVELGCPRAKIAIIPMGINLERFQFQPRRWDGSGPINVLMVASFVAKKGHSLALDALARLRPDYPLHLHLVGDGELRPQIEAQIRQLGLEDAVTLYGNLAYATAGPRGDNAHLFLLPSRTAADGNQEGLPTVLIEAQARGLPVLATEHAGIPAIVAHGRSGLLAPENDLAALVAHWRTLLEQHEQWPAFGANGRTIVEESFDARTQAARFEALYAEVEASL